MTPVSDINAKARSRYRIAVVDDHLLFAESLELTLSIEGYDARAVPLRPDGSSPAALTSALVRMRPRLVVLDLALGPSGDGVRLVRPLVLAGIDVVVVTAERDRGRWGEAVLNGARAVVGKDAPLPSVLAVVRRLHQGAPVMSAAEREELVARYVERQAARAEDRRRLERLTTRERGVLRELMAGHPVREIARAAVVSEATVRSQVKAILGKLEVSSQIAAVGLAHQSQWRCG